MVKLIKYDFSEERNNFAQHYGEDNRDILSLNDTYFIQFDAHVGAMGLYVTDIKFMIKYVGSYI